MNDLARGAPATPAGGDAAKVTPLTAAIHAARLENAERGEALAEVRGAQNARLEMLADAVRGDIEAAPSSHDLFDFAISQGAHPRLFIDVIGFVEMAHDRRTYRFLQETRHGRLVLAESDNINTMSDVVRHYVARRVVERESALAADQTVEKAAAGYALRQGMVASPAPAAVTLPPPPPRKARRPGIFTRLMMFVVEFLGVVALLSLIAYGLMQFEPPVAAWLTAHQPVNLPMSLPGAAK
ncbi:MAG: hypothetical protein KGQ37_12045 [Hyphomicrobiales bacterium]|nr:hypothetical protein [Hyphomicrobiales bacterium]